MRRPDLAAARRHARTMVSRVAGVPLAALACTAGTLREVTVVESVGEDGERQAALVIPLDDLSLYCLERLCSAWDVVLTEPGEQARPSLPLRLA